MTGIKGVPAVLRIGLVLAAIFFLEQNWSVLRAEADTCQSSKSDEGTPMAKNAVSASDENSKMAVEAEEADQVRDETAQDEKDAQDIKEDTADDGGAAHR